MILIASSRDPERHAVLVLEYVGDDGRTCVARIGPRDVRFFLELLGCEDNADLRALDKGEASIRGWPAMGRGVERLPGEGS